MATDLGPIARRLFERVMAPLALGGAIQPGHAIGARVALALGDAASRASIDGGLFDHVQTARVRRARELAPVDELGPATPAEWALAAALHDVLQATNPSFDAVLRRKAAGRVLASAMLAIDRVAPPAHVGEALARHSWFARVLTTQRVDTTVSWWTGSQTFRGEPPPARLQLWPDLRRVTVVPRSLSLLELQPLAVDRDTLALALSRLLDRTPLTAVATCARAGPVFAWTDATLALVATDPGRTLALRALRREPGAEVDEALGRATRELQGKHPDRSWPALVLLGDRALAAAQGKPSERRASPNARLARAIGARVALKALAGNAKGWPAEERQRMIANLLPVVSAWEAQLAPVKPVETA